MIKVCQKSILMDKVPVLEQTMGINAEFNKKEIQFEHLDYRLQNITKELDNLKAVMDQIEREKICEINKLLKT